MARTLKASVKLTRLKPEDELDPYDRALFTNRKPAGADDATVTAYFDVVEPEVTQRGKRNKLIKDYVLTNKLKRPADFRVSVLRFKVVKEKVPGAARLTEPQRLRLRGLEQSLTTYRRNLGLPAPIFPEAPAEAFEAELWTNSNRCPECGSEDLDAHDHDGDKDLTESVRCDACGASWVCHYRYVGASDFTAGGGGP